MRCRGGASALVRMRKYANAGAKLHCGGEVGVVRGERGGTVAGAGEGRWRAECSWEGI